MGRNRSLDEFSNSEATPAEEDATPETEADDRRDSEQDSGRTEKNGEQMGGDAQAAPINPTYAWSPDGKPCADCGTIVTTRWRTENAYVCGECKDWSATHE